MAVHTTSLGIRAEQEMRAELVDAALRQAQGTLQTSLKHFKTLESHAFGSISEYRNPAVVCPLDWAHAQSCHGNARGLSDWSGS